MNIIPVHVINKCMNLHPAQLTAVFAGSGEDVVVESAECVGMTRSGTFVYRCQGTVYSREYNREDGTYQLTDPVPLAQMQPNFEFSVSHNPQFLDNFKNHLEEGRLRTVDDVYVLRWDYFSDKI
jgi:hypothetical protein